MIRLAKSSVSGEDSYRPPDQKMLQFIIVILGEMLKIHQNRSRKMPKKYNTSKQIFLVCLATAILKIC